MQERWYVGKLLEWISTRVRGKVSNRRIEKESREEAVRIRGNEYWLVIRPIGIEKETNERPKKQAIAGNTHRPAAQTEKKTLAQWIGTLCVQNMRLYAIPCISICPFML